ncbi:MAG: hypothetical protein FWD15_03360 [Alphaproteobacteria bacterium]|nr:hypothetical protein [Alphaproteobacteria bacterium]
MAEQTKKHGGRPRRPFNRPRPANGNFKPQGKRGLASFLFGFTGSISKELYTGAYIVSYILFSLMIGLQLLTAGAPAFIGGAITAIEIMLFIVILSLGYKRAHALGFSGIYSIVGTTLFAPLFMFYRSDRDNAGDGSYKYAFTKFKKLGSYLGKDAIMKIATIAAVFAINALMNAPRTGADAASLSNFQMMILGLFVFNVAQLWLYKFAFVRRYYINTFKVLSFLAYNLALATFIVGITVSVVLYQLTAGMGLPQ